MWRGNERLTPHDLAASQVSVPRLSIARLSTARTSRGKNENPCCSMVFDAHFDIILKFQLILDSDV